MKQIVEDYGSIRHVRHIYRPLITMPASIISGVMAGIAFFILVQWIYSTLCPYRYIAVYSVLTGIAAILLSVLTMMWISSELHDVLWPPITFEYAPWDIVFSDVVSNSDGKIMSCRIRRDGRMVDREIGEIEPEQEEWLKQHPRGINIYERK